MHSNINKSVSQKAPPTFAGLTMNINQATLPSVPFFVPQGRPVGASEAVSSFVGQEDVESETGSSVPTPRPLPTDLPSAASSSRTGPRSRYVLPPGISTTHVGTEQSLPNPLPATSTAVSPLHPQIYPSVNPSPTLSMDPEPHIPVAGSMSLPTYQPVPAVWFYATVVNRSRIWWPFSRFDNAQLESGMLASPLARLASSETLVAVDESKDDSVVPVEGGRYDVYVNKRERHAVYWDELATEVRRATWFYRSPNEARVLPFSEKTAELLESQYKTSIENNVWGQRFEVPSEDPRGGTDYFIFHSPQSMIQYRAWPYTIGSVSDAMPAVSRPFETPEGVQPKTIPSLTDAEHDGRICFVRRGLDEQLMQQLEEGESVPVDHLFFVVHGIGTVYNLKGQGLVECVNNLRRTARQIAASHFPHHQGRTEFLPIMWHDNLHSDATGLDEQLNQVTLRSIPKLRQFTNGTLMDILFYTSSKYCQVIVDTVAKEVCRLREIFLSRNPRYSGGFSIVGHSLGAVIAFDLLSNQRPLNELEEEHHSTSNTCKEIGVSGSERRDESPERIETPIDKSDQSSSTGGETECWSLVGHEDSGKQSLSDFGRFGNGKGERSSEIKRLMDLLLQAGLGEDQADQVVNTWLGDTTKDAQSPHTIVGHPSSGGKATQIPRHSFWSIEGDHMPILTAGFGMPVVVYPQLGFPITAFFMLGSPLSLFLTARGIKHLSADYQLPTCPMVFNVFHPFDPVAYRVETLIDPAFQPRAVLMPHHKGRKRLHLQLRDNLARVGADLKAKLFQSVQSTWKSLQDFAASHGFFTNQTDINPDQSGDDEEANVFKKLLSRLDNQPGECDDAEFPTSDHDLKFTGHLNHGRRIDFVLQEAPLESFSDYLFALGSHAAYWESEDTALFLLSEVYALNSILPVGVGVKQTELSSNDLKLSSSTSVSQTHRDISVVNPSVSYGASLSTPVITSSIPDSMGTSSQSAIDTEGSTMYPVLQSYQRPSAPPCMPPCVPFVPPSAHDALSHQPPFAGLPSVPDPKPTPPALFPAYQHNKLKATNKRPPTSVAQLYQPGPPESLPQSVPNLPFNPSRPTQPIVSSYEAQSITFNPTLPEFVQQSCPGPSLFTASTTSESNPSVFTSNIMPPTSGL